MSNIAKEIRESIRLLKSIGEDSLASDLLCALAAITNTEAPRADLTYTSIMRDLRNKDKESVLPFQIAFKKAFDEALDEGLDSPEQVALMQAIHEVNLEL